MNKNQHIRLHTLYDDLKTRVRSLSDDSSRVRAARRLVEEALKGDEVYYGINTGFGALAQNRIPPDQLLKLQKNLLLSHSVGVGEWVPKDISRLMLLLKLHSLGLGYSGISVDTFERLLRFAQLDLVPAVPSRGSVGASGDLAPLAHMSLPLIGLGCFWDEPGTKIIPAQQLLAQHGLEPLVLQPKDGLSLINGTQLMCAYGAYVLEKCRNLLTAADLICAMSLEALQGSVRPFDSRFQQLRPHPGQSLVAENVRMLLKDSEILESHRNCGKVQDPYCLRCAPQVHGAVRDALAFAGGAVEVEINAVTDNPLVFENGEILSGGNFHGEPLAMALDFAAIALSELGGISERRTYLLLEGHDGLPKLLMREIGINSGFMMPQYTAAALVSENKVLSHPASVDSIPTSLGQEDHVSMGSISALKLLPVFRNVEVVLAVELFTAAQALDFRKPLKPGRGVEVAHNHVRALIPHKEEDHLLQEDLKECIAVIRSPQLVQAVEAAVGKLN
ncbi:MAG: histidine ammonia-lyase [Acidobacteria bacterium]|nr:MAG: histidine ammonia-lyase [Acidobacteriota bacterium]